VSTVTRLTRQFVTHTGLAIDGTKAGVSYSLRGKRILVVEDEVDALDLIELMLKAAGADVAKAESGDAALAHMRQAPFDLVVSDIGLPEMDGYQLAGELRKLSRSHGTDPKMIAFTAYADSAHRQRAVDAGFEAHIAKPVDPVALVSLVTHLLSLS